MKLATISTLIAAAGCAPAAAGSGDAATADLRDANGTVVATATLTQHANGVHISVRSTGIPAGVHGIHLHETGTCAPPDFTSAGGHFNPTGDQHGFENPSGPHAGDLRNMEVGSDGSGSYSEINDRVTLSPGANSVFDADGTALVIHAGPDDYRTDPAGNSGARIACGVITR